MAASVGLKKILEDVLQMNPKMETLSSSHGAASQFKNKCTMQYASKMAMEENILLEWNYFSTSHGKGVVDGIGGTLKKMADSHSLRQKLRPFQSR